MLGEGLGGVGAEDYTNLDSFVFLESCEKSSVNRQEDRDSERGGRVPAITQPGRPRAITLLSLPCALPPTLQQGV